MKYQTSDRCRSAHSERLKFVFIGECPNFHYLVGREAVHTCRDDASAGRESFSDLERICVAGADLYFSHRHLVGGCIDHPHKRLAIALQDRGRRQLDLRADIYLGHRFHDGSQPEIQRWIDQRDPDASSASRQVRLGCDLSHLSLDSRGGIRFRGNDEALPRTKVDRDFVRHIDHRLALLRANNAQHLLPRLNDLTDFGFGRDNHAVEPGM